MTSTTTTGATTGAARGGARGSGRVGVGVIGAGTISTQYLTNLTSFPDLDVRVVADLAVDRARAQAEAFGVPRWGAVEDVLSDPDVEVVVNLTIPAAHVEVATAAVAAGKDVWTEKPFALDRASGTSLLEAAAAADRRVATAPDTFLGAGLQSARRLLESGAVGDPLTALVLLQSAGPESWHPDPAFLFAEGAGPLFDIGPYYLTALVQLLGPVGRVSATASKARAQRTIGSGPKAGQVFDVEVPTHVSALFEFEGGASATTVFSFDSAVNRTQLEVAGAGGTLELPDPNTFEGDTVVHAIGEEARSEAPTGSTAGRGHGVLELARAIRAGRPERASGEQAFHVLDVMVSTIEAAQRRSPVEVESTTTVAPALPADWDPTARTL
jgi:predicted dehydrogenase